jgi:hypothetical protein
VVFNVSRRCNICSVEWTLNDDVGDKRNSCLAEGYHQFFSRQWWLHWSGFETRSFVIKVDLDAARLGWLK